VGEGELCSPEPFAGGAEPFRGSAVIDVLQVARVRILRYLARRGVVHLLPETLEIIDAWAAGRLRRPRTIAGGHGNPSRVPMSDDELASRDPVLAQLAAAAVSGLPPAGPEQRCRPAVQLARTDSAGPTPVGALVVQELGFNLPAVTAAIFSAPLFAAGDRKGIQNQSLQCTPAIEWWSQFLRCRTRPAGTL